MLVSGGPCSLLYLVVCFFQLTIPARPPPSFLHKNRIHATGVQDPGAAGDRRNREHRTLNFSAKPIRTDHRPTTTTTSHVLSTLISA
uniref:Putative secreted protein n=1 Tax=Ixodes ricinus TaxID=34613 RepID=A0A6B0UB48_IXORI